MPVQFEVTKDSLEPSLRERLASVELTGLHKNIAELLFTVSQRSFRNEESPSGEPWAPLSPATFELSFRKRHQDADAYKRVGGQKVPTSDFQNWINKKRNLGILRQSKSLIQLNTAFNEERATIGSGLPYARIQQLGSDGPMKGFIKSELPARPYVGLGEKDRSIVSEMVAEHFRDEMQR